MSDRPKWVRDLAFFLADDIMDEAHGYPMDGSDDEVLDAVETAVHAVLCGHYGHEVIDDHCGIPAHRYCVHCSLGIASIEAQT